MKRPRNRVACERNNRWYERYGKDGYFCLPRALLFNVVDCIDNAAFYAYVALASCHYEGNTTYAASHVAKLTGKDESGVRGYLADLETLGLITRETFGRGYKIIFECPTRSRIKQGVAVLATRKSDELQRRQQLKQAKADKAVPAPKAPPPPQFVDDDMPNMGDLWGDD